MDYTTPTFVKRVAELQRSLQHEKKDYERPSWDQVRMNMAHVIAERSVCDRDQVGAIIVSAQNRVIAEGYNGPPAGLDFLDANGEPRLELGCRIWCARAQAGSVGESLHGEYWDCPTIHAEINALLYSDESARRGGTIYVTSGVCFGCAKTISNSGLRRVVVDLSHASAHGHRSLEQSFELLRSVGITVDEMYHTK